MSYHSGFWAFSDARCSVPFKPVGCFKDNQKKNARPLGELLLTYRDRKSAKNNGTEINWGEWDVYLYELVCLCAQKAKEKKYSHFGLQHYGRRTRATEHTCTIKSLIRVFFFKP